jgi:hypothetical protein
MEVRVGVVAVVAAPLLGGVPITVLIAPLRDLRVGDPGTRREDRERQR